MHFALCGNVAGQQQHLGKSLHWDKSPRATVHCQPVSLTTQGCTHVPNAVFTHMLGLCSRLVTLAQRLGYSFHMESPLAALTDHPKGPPHHEM